MFRSTGHKSLDILKVLASLRTKALRRGLWFEALSSEDRVLASLIGKNIKIVKNATLAAVIARIIGKLFIALRKSAFLSRLEMLGRPLALMYSEKACAMGNKDALTWASDPNYIRYLGLVAAQSRSSKSFVCAKADVAA